jgi:hypothetical protein
MSPPVSCRVLGHDSLCLRKSPPGPILEVECLSLGYLGLSGLDFGPCFMFGPKFIVLGKFAYFTVIHEIMPRVQGVRVDGSDLNVGTSASK